MHPCVDLIDAAGKGDYLEVKRLLAKGANVNTRDRDVRSALLEATNSGHYVIVRHLLAVGADPGARNRYGYSALFIAVKHGHYAIVTELLTTKPDINTVYYIPDLSILMVALKYYRIAIVDKLLQNGGVNINAKNKSGSTALLFAFDLATVIMLLDAGADVNAENENGVTALSIATSRRDLPVVEKLLAVGADATRVHRDKYKLCFKLFDQQPFVSHKF